MSQNVWLILNHTLGYNQQYYSILCDDIIHLDDIISTWDWRKITENGGVL